MVRTSPNSTWVEASQREAVASQRGVAKVEGAYEVKGVECPLSEEANAQGIACIGKFKLIIMLLLIAPFDAGMATPTGAAWTTFATAGTALTLARGEGWYVPRYSSWQEEAKLRRLSAGSELSSFSLATLTRSVGLWGWVGARVALRLCGIEALML